MTDEKELEILENIYLNCSVVSQRDLAGIAGLSLGMTNSIVKRLVKKGWLSIKKVNNRNIRYVVSPRGLEAISRKSYRYLKRTVKNVVQYRQDIENLIRLIKKNGYNRLVLVGNSDLDFIVEYCCQLHAVKMIQGDPDVQNQHFILYAERYIPDELDEKPGNCAFLQQVLMTGSGVE